jgi:DNA recombination protein RmuC
METLIPALIGLLVGALFGGLLGWLLGHRAAGNQPQHPLLVELRQQLTQRDQALAQLRDETAQARLAIASAQARQETAEQLLAEERRLNERQLAETRAMQESALKDLRDTFKALSLDALKQTQPEFLRLATETFSRFNETAKGELGQRQQAIATPC